MVFLIGMAKGIWAIVKVCKFVVVVVYGDIVLVLSEIKCAENIIYLSYIVRR